MVMMDVVQFVLWLFYVTDKQNQIQIDLIHDVQMMIKIELVVGMVLLQLEHHHYQLELKKYR